MRDALLFLFGVGSILAANELTWWLWGRYRAAEVRDLKTKNAALVVEIEGLRTGGQP